MADQIPPVEGQSGTPGPLEGQGAAPDSGQGEVWWKAPDGTAFESPDHLARTWNESVMMRRDYTKKTQGVAEERRALEEQRRRFDLDREEHGRLSAEREERARKYETFDRLLKERPDVYRELEKRLKGAPGADVIAERVQKQFEEKYGSKLTELEQWKAAQEADKFRGEAYAALKAKYPDFDGEAVDKDLDELAARLRSGQDHRELIGFLAERMFLSKRTAKPVTSEQIEEEKQNAQLLPATGSAPSAPRKPARNIEEARQRAHRTGG